MNHHRNCRKTTLAIANFILALGVGLPIFVQESAFAAGNLNDGLNADLIYDMDSGAVVLDATDTDHGLIEVFFLATDHNNFRPENVQLPWLDVGTNTDVTEFAIGQASPTNMGAGPLIRLGEIFPAGIATGSELAAYLTEANYTSAAPSPHEGEFDLIVIPEPRRTGILVAACFLAVVLRLRTADYRDTCKRPAMRGFGT